MPSATLSNTESPTVLITVYRLDETHWSSNLTKRRHDEQTAEKISHFQPVIASQED